MPGSAPLPRVHVSLATDNEAGNLRILVIDDNSPDGPGYIGDQTHFENHRSRVSKIKKAKAVKALDIILQFGADRLSGHRDACPTCPFWTIAIAPSYL